MVVRAARLWDGKSSTVREDVDVLISGGRIAGVSPRGAIASDVQVVEAPTGTVMPGLIDGHGHAGHGLVKSLGMDTRSRPLGAARRCAYPASPATPQIIAAKAAGAPMTAKSLKAY